MIEKENKLNPDKTPKAIVGDDENAIVDTYSNSVSQTITQNHEPCGFILNEISGLNDIKKDDNLQKNNKEMLKSKKFPFDKKKIKELALKLSKLKNRECDKKFNKLI